MAGGVDEMNRRIAPHHAYAGGLDRYAPPLFNGQIVRMRRALIHAAGLPDGSGMGQKLFAESGLASVHMGENADIPDCWLHHMDSSCCTGCRCTPQIPMTITAEATSCTQPKGSPRKMTPASREITVVRLQKTVACATGSSVLA